MWAFRLIVALTISFLLQACHSNKNVSNPNAAYEQTEVIGKR